MKYTVHTQGSCKAPGKLLYPKLPMRYIDIPARIVHVQYKDLNLVLDAGYGEKLHNVTRHFPERAMRFITPFKTPKEDITTYADTQKRNVLIYTHYHVDHVGNFDADTVFECVGSHEELSYIHSNTRLRNLHTGNVKGLVVPSQKITAIESYKVVEDSIFSTYFKKIYQFEDYPIYFVSLFGHSYRQYGVLIPELNMFYVADSVYAPIELKRKNLSRILQRIAHNTREAQDTFHRLQRFVEDFEDYDIITSHDWS